MIRKKDCMGRREAGIPSRAITLNEGQRAVLAQWGKNAELKQQFGAFSILGYWHSVHGDFEVRTAQNDGVISVFIKTPWDGILEKKVVFFAEGETVVDYAQHHIREILNAVEIYVMTGTMSW